MINLLIVGYHGFGNCGDDATLLAMVSGIRSMSDDVHITALSYAPEFTRTEYNIDTVQRFNISAVVKTIKKSDIVLLGGGSLLQDSTSTRSLVYYLGIIRAAKMFNKKVMLYANGFGPIYKTFNQKMTKKIANDVDIITLRDKCSEDDMKKMGINKPEIYVTADAAFTLKPIDKKYSISLLEKENIPTDKDIIGISIRYWSRAIDVEKYIKAIAKACDEFAVKGKIILLIPMQFPEDVEISKKVMSNMKEKSYILSKGYSPAKISGIISCCKIIVSMRLHALLFAAIERVPMIGIIYDPKVANYLEVLSMPAAGNIENENIKSEDISLKIKDVFDNMDKYKSILDEKVSILINNANKNNLLLNEQLELIRKEKMEENLK